MLFSITDGFGVGELSGIVADIPPIALSNRFLNKFILCWLNIQHNILFNELVKPIHILQDYEVYELVLP